MSVFKDEKHVYSTLGSLWKQAFALEEVRSKFNQLGVTVHFIIHEPEAELWLFPDGVVEGPANQPLQGALLEMEMSGDTAHRFWMDKLSVPLAVAKRQIKARGPINKVLGLLPQLKPLKQLYPEIAKQEGLPLE
jgi:hypothetical protein